LFFFFFLDTIPSSRRLLKRHNFLTLSSPEYRSYHSSGIRTAISSSAFRPASFIDCKKRYAFLPTSPLKPVRSADFSYKYPLGTGAARSFLTLCSEILYPIPSSSPESLLSLTSYPHSLFLFFSRSLAKSAGPRLYVVIIIGQTEVYSFGPAPKKISVCYPPDNAAA